MFLGITFLLGLGDLKPDRVALGLKSGSCSPCKCSVPEEEYEAFLGDFAIGADGDEDFLRIELRLAVSIISLMSSPWMSILRRSVLVILVVTFSVSIRENFTSAPLKVTGIVRPCDGDLPRGESPIVG